MQGNNAIMIVERYPAIPSKESAMGLACKITGHKWNGCVCARCGAKHGVSTIILPIQRAGGFE